MNTLSIIRRGYCEDNCDIEYVLYENGHLEISGTGEIPEGAFEDWRDIVTVTVNEGITKLSDDAFIRCYGLERITLPNTLEDIGISVFTGCTKLNDLTIPSSVKHIGTEAFYHCESLTRLSFDKSGVQVDPDAFACSPYWLMIEMGIPAFPNGMTPSAPIEPEPEPEPESEMDIEIRDLFMKQMLLDEIFQQQLAELEKPKKKGLAGLIDRLFSKK